LDYLNEPRNQLLRSLRAAELAVLRPYLEPYSLTADMVLYRPEDRVRWVYFPETGLVSRVTVMLSGDTIETSLIGREGGAPIAEALGSEMMFSWVVVRMPGEALRVKALHLQSALAASATLRRAIYRHFELLQVESRQAIACHGMHTIGERLCYWLLEFQDRTGGLSELPLTQERLADILGVSRPSVSHAASLALDRGWIKYARGMIHIVDREGLESGACECRGLMGAFRQRLELIPPLRRL
jgi:CRP-like cAMP-binding protein